MRGARRPATFARDELDYSPVEPGTLGAHWYQPLRQGSGEQWLDGLWSGRFVAPETAGLAVVACSVPIYHLRGGSNRFDGVVSIDVSTDVFRDFFRNIDLYREAQIYLIGADRKVALVVTTGSQGDRGAEARTMAQVAERPEAFGGFTQIQEANNPEGWFVAANPYSGEETLILFKTLRHTPAQLLYAIPVRSVKEKSLSLSRWIAFLGFFSIVGAWGLLLRWSAGQATRNLDVLRLGVREMQQGNRRIKLKPAAANDETADVIAAFNTMVDEVDRSLRHAEQLAGERERQASELDLARRIQESSLPAPIDLPGGEIFGRMLPAQEVAGDFYEHFPLPYGRVALIVGDVSGKSVSAALFAARTRRSCYAVWRRCSNPPTRWRKSMPCWRVPTPSRCSSRSSSPSTIRRSRRCAGSTPAIIRRLLIRANGRSRAPRTARRPWRSACSRGSATARAKRRLPPATCWQYIPMALPRRRHRTASSSARSA